MGMYTEFHFNSELKRDIPIEILSLIKLMCWGMGDKYTRTLPKHPLFDTERWRWMLNMGSYYFSAQTKSTLTYDKISRCYTLCIRCNLKNYGDEIQKFIDWIDQYLDKYKGSFLGFYRYEEFEEPTLIYKQ